MVIVTNVEADHLDHYSGIEEIEATFAKFMSLVGEDGTVIVCGEDPHLVELAKSTGRHVLSYGFAESNDIVCMHPDVKGIQSDFIVRFEDGTEHAVEIKSNPGRHNMLNALACCAAAEFLGVPTEAAEKGLNKFTGSSRRFQLVGRMPNGATVVDDYAHHPSEMKATLSTAKEMHFDRILCAFQPHTYTRTKALFSEFVDALKQCDQAILAPIYAAREQNTIGIYSSDIAKEVPGAVSFDTFDEIADYLRKNAGPNDLVLTMGAGNINTVGPMLIK